MRGSAHRARTCRHGTIGGQELVYQKLPSDISKRFVMLLDPVLGTGNTACKTIQVRLARRGMLHLREGRCVGTGYSVSAGGEEGYRAVCLRTTTALHTCCAWDTSPAVYTSRGAHPHMHLQNCCRRCFSTLWWCLAYRWTCVFVAVPQVLLDKQVEEGKIMLLCLIAAPPGIHKVGACKPGAGCTLLW